MVARRPGQRGSEVLSLAMISRETSPSRRTGQIYGGATIGRAEPAVTADSDPSPYFGALASSPAIASTSIDVSRPVPPTPKQVAVVLVVFAVNHHAHSVARRAVVAISGERVRGNETVAGVPVTVSVGVARERDLHRTQ